jgi:hypothetical protein
MTVRPSILRLMIAAILGGILILWSLAIEQATDNKKIAILGEHPQGVSREHPQEMGVKGSSLPSTASGIQSTWSIGAGTR